MNRMAYLLLFLALPALMNAQAPKHEFRGVWIATVDNIDWPSKAARSSSALQKQEFISLLDMHVRNGMNAVVMQIRPAADAFFPSSYEPWSEWLTGKQGRPPSPYYDPLEFMITETHKRGLEFHAWFNPYRAVFKIGTSSIAPTHITRIHPEWFLTYGDKRYFDPGNPLARRFVTDIVTDVVERYDLDAIHFDDYFYPYRIAGKEFPDQAGYLKWGKGMNKEDWRRSNVDTIIRMLGETIKKTNPRVQFGISPFGIWRNKSKDPEGSDTKGGQTNYDDLYADILLWLKNGWIDYVVPQLYWEIGHKLADYETLIEWWSKHGYGRNIYIGHGIYRAGTNAAWKDPNEIPAQLEMLREYPEFQGSVYFSSKSFTRNPNGWNDSLRNNFYKYPALPPPLKWIDSIAPIAPQINMLVKDNALRLVASPGAGSEKLKAFMLYRFPQDVEAGTSQAEYVQKMLPLTATNEWIIPFPAEGEQYQFALSAVDRNNNESGLSPVITIRRRNNNWIID